MTVPPSGSPPTSTLEQLLAARCGRTAAAVTSDTGRNIYPAGHCSWCGAPASDHAGGTTLPITMVIPALFFADHEARGRIRDPTSFKRIAVSTSGDKTQLTMSLRDAYELLDRLIPFVAAIGSGVPTPIQTAARNTLTALTAAGITNAVPKATKRAT